MPPLGDMCPRAHRWAPCLSVGSEGREAMKDGKVQSFLIPKPKNVLHTELGEKVPFLLTPYWT